MAFRVLDASAFYAGIPFASSEKCYTTPSVYEEVKHIKKNYQAVEILLETKRLEVINPQDKYLEKVSREAEKTGDIQNLSREDVSVVALSLQLDADLITDDFAVSNIAKHMKVNVLPIMTKGITRIVEWSYFCPACKKAFSKISECPICGNKLKRKLIKGKSSSGPIGKRAVI